MTEDIPPFEQSSLPAGAWNELIHWLISCSDDAAAARAAAAAVVGAAPASHHDQPVFASARARVELAMSELLSNGLRHGTPPIRATLSRGQDAWLLIVSDAAIEQPPRFRHRIGGSARGGLGMPLITTLSSSAGWYTDQTEKHVWALIGDEAPQDLITALRHTGGPKVG